MTARTPVFATLLLLGTSIACAPAAPASTPDAAAVPDAATGTDAAATHDAATITDAAAAHDTAMTTADASLRDAAVDAAVLTELAPCTADVTQLFSQDAINPPAGGSGVFHAAATPQHQALDATLRALIAGNVTLALQHAQQAAYQVCRSDDDGSTVVVIQPLVSGEGHAVIAWRADASVPVIIEAPHAWHDADTDIQSVELFLALRARALIVSGIYRCSSLDASPCDGITTACTGLPIRYTRSDAAHNVEMLFHTAHVALSEVFATDSVISMHGFGYAGVSVSNITRESPALDSLHVRLVAALQSALPGETITSCQDYAGAPYERRMCGDDNVQGRHLHGSANACADNTLTNSGRFVHVEQSRTIRRDHRTAVIQAFEDALSP